MKPCRHTPVVVEVETEYSLGIVVPSAESAPRMSGHQRDDPVAEHEQLVHSVGTPMSHATHCGFNFPPTRAFSGGVFLRDCEGGPSFFASCVVGVGQSRTASSRHRRPDSQRDVAVSSGGCPRRASPSLACGVGHICATPVSVARSFPLIPRSRW
jgi:hypothetical protein